jgi:PD-(D/E)XK nuclease superfamily protein
MKVTDYITQRIAQKRAERQHERTSWYPSDVGLCDRKSVLARAGVAANAFSPDTLRTFWLGETVHQGIQSLLDGPDFWHEVGVKAVYENGSEIHGKIDTIRYIDNDYEVVEYKTQRDNAFKYKLPKDNHVLQVACYLALPIVDERFPSPPRLARGTLVYIGKESGRTEEYVVENTKELRDKVYAIFDNLEAHYQKYLRDGSLPPALPKQWTTYNGKKKLDEPFAVRYCDYRGTGKCCGDGR